MAYIGSKPANKVLTASDITDGIVSNAKLAQDIISGDTALASEPSDTDEFLVSDSGTLKRIDYSLIKGGGGMTFISSTVPSGSASSVEVQNCFSSTYLNYLIIFSGISIATNNSNMTYEFMTGTNTRHTSGYYWVLGTSNRNGTQVDEAGNNGSEARYISNTSNDDDTINGNFVVYGANAAVKTGTTSQFTHRYESSASAFPESGGCWVNAGDQFTGIAFDVGNGSNFDNRGTIKVYGIHNS
jgi:hypothetical protein